VLVFQTTVDEHVRLQPPQDLAQTGAHAFVKCGGVGFLGVVDFDQFYCIDDNDWAEVAIPIRHLDLAVVELRPVRFDLQPPAVGLELGVEGLLQLGGLKVREIKEHVHHVVVVIASLEPGRHFSISHFLCLLFALFEFFLRGGVKVAFPLNVPPRIFVSVNIFALGHKLKYFFTADLLLI